MSKFWYDCLLDREVIRKTPLFIEYSINGLSDEILQVIGLGIADSVIYYFGSGWTSPGFYSIEGRPNGKTRMEMIHGPPAADSKFFKSMYSRVTKE